MVAQKTPKKLVAIFFFSILNAQKAIIKSKSRELKGIISARKWFENLLHSICFQKESKFWKPGN